MTWDKERDKKPHLNRADSEAILRRVLALYQDHFDEKPHRVVLHKTSRYWPEELEGFRAALDDIHSYDFLALERRGVRFLRLGKEPPVRGTVIELGNRDYLVFTQGYVPFIRQYPGMRIPNPLEIVEHCRSGCPPTPREHFQRDFNPEGFTAWLAGADVKAAYDSARRALATSVAAKSRSRFAGWPCERGRRTADNGSSTIGIT